MILRSAALRSAVSVTFLALGSACGEEPDPLARSCGQGLPPQTRVAVSSGPGQWEREGSAPHLEELWRAGGTREDEALATPTWPAAGPSGRLSVPDFRLGTVAVLGPDGSWLGPWVRQGEGPGEVSRPVAATWNVEGRLAVLDVESSRVVFLRGGEPARDDLPVDPAFTGRIVASGQLHWAGVGPYGTVYAIGDATTLGGAGGGGAGPEAGGDRPGRAKDRVLLRLPPGAESAETVASLQVPTLGQPPYEGRAIPGANDLAAAVGVDGTLAVAGEEARYAIDLYDASGRLRLRICREAEAKPLRADERGDVGSGSSGAQGESRAELMNAIEEAPRPERLAAVGRLFIGTRGRIWAGRDRPSPLDSSDGVYGRAGGEWDVFQEDGTYLGTVEAPPEARLQAAAGDTVWALAFGDFDEPWVVAYRIVSSDDSDAADGVG